QRFCQRPQRSTHRTESVGQRAARDIDALAQVDFLLEVQRQ
ncbi:hypothetical protein SSYM_1386, partial [Serratia symbiotica str. Tucson]